MRRAMRWNGVRTSACRLVNRRSHCNDSARRSWVHSRTRLCWRRTVHCLGTAGTTPSSTTCSSGAHTGGYGSGQPGGQPCARSCGWLKHGAALPRTSSLCGSSLPFGLRPWARGPARACACEHVCGQTHLDLFWKLRLGLTLHAMRCLRARLPTVALLLSLQQRCAATSAPTPKTSPVRCTTCWWCAASAPSWTTSTGGAVHVGRWLQGQIKAGQGQRVLAKSRHVASDVLNRIGSSRPLFPGRLVAGRRAGRAAGVPTSFLKSSPRLTLGLRMHRAHREELSDLGQIVANSANLIFIMTDNIFDSPWCLKELDAGG